MTTMMQPNMTPANSLSEEQQQQVAGTTESNLTRNEEYEEMEQPEAPPTTGTEVAPSTKEQQLNEKCHADAHNWKLSGTSELTVCGGCWLGWCVLCVNCNGCACFCECTCT